MKLLFPGGEHPQVLLNPGLNRVGSDPEGSVVLARPGVHPRHFDLFVTATGVNLQLPEGAGAVQVGGKPVDSMMALRNGDIIGFAGINCKFVVVEVARSVAPAAGAGAAPEMDGDSGATRVRAALPKFLLRGVSGQIFGKMFPITGPTTIGRSAECDIAVPVEEISRRHALVKPVADGLMIEDLGSSNGTYINNKRIQTGHLGPGDELRLDAVRFLLVAPGMEMQSQAPKPAAAPAPAAAGSPLANTLLIGVIVVSAIVVVAVLLLR